jgi:hypothetical protein
MRSETRSIEAGATVTGTSLSVCGGGEGTEESPGLKTNPANKSRKASDMRNALRVIEFDRFLCGVGQVKKIMV